MRTGFDRRGFMNTPAPISYDYREPTHLYAIRCDKFVKVGIAVSIEKRRLSLSVGNPFPLIVQRADLYTSRLEALLVERAAHAALKDVHHEGEWFRARPQRIDGLFDEIRVAMDWLRPKHRAELEERRARYAATMPASRALKLQSV